jgi:hypothetical protein
MNETAVFNAGDNSLLVSISAVLLLALGPILLAARFAWPKRFLWRHVALLAAICSLALAYCLESLEGPGDYIYKPTFVTIWLRSIMYTVPWLGLYLVLQLVRRRRSQRGHDRD